MRCERNWSMETRHCIDFMGKFTARKLQFDMPLKKNVLLIDDEEAFNIIHTAILGETDRIGQIESVTNGRTAIHYLENKIVNNQSLPHLIFLDINMPVMSGFEFMQEIIAHPAIDHKNLTIVILSSSMDARDKRRAKELGILHFLEKPLDLSYVLTFLIEP